MQILVASQHRLVATLLLWMQLACCTTMQHRARSRVVCAIEAILLFNIIRTYAAATLSKPSLL
jgi:hypothetical protein